MTKNERKLINAALTWLAADLTPCAGHEDNWAEGNPKDDLEAAAADVANERGRPILSYFDPEPFRAVRRANRAKMDALRKLEL